MARHPRRSYHDGGRAEIRCALSHLARLGSWAVSTPGIRSPAHPGKIKVTDEVRLRGVSCSGTRVVTILREFGVLTARTPYKQGSGGGFWHRCEADLEYIFRDYQQAARKLKQQLHPDTPGGDAEKFTVLSQKCVFIERRFAAHLPHLQNSMDYALRVERARATSEAHKKRNK